MKPILLLAAVFMLTSSKAQPNVQWQRSLGGTGYDEAYALQQTIDGGYVLAGRSRSANGDVSGIQGLDDFWVVRLDNVGNILWQKSLGGTANDGAVAARQTSDGGVVVAGWTYSNNGMVSGNHGNADAWVVKLSSSGALEWQKTFGGSAEDAAYAVEQTTDGGYIVAGYTFSTDGIVSGNHGNADAWVLKLDAAGTLVWQKPFGGSNQDKAYDVLQANDGGFVMAGFSNSNDGDVDGNHGDFDYWMVKMDASGTFEWQRTLGGPNEDDAISVQQTSDGGFILGGMSFSNDGDVSGNHGNMDYWVVKLDAASNIIWQRSLGGSGQDKAYCVRETADGNFVVAGSSNSTDGDVTNNHGGDDYWLVKLNAAGAMVWEKSMGGSGSDVAWPMQPTSDGGYIVAGWSNSFDGDVTNNHGDKDIWLVKLASDAIGIAETGGLGHFTLFPNLTAGSFTLQLDGPRTNMEARLLDLAGRTVQVLPIGLASTATCSLNVANGSYFLQLQAGTARSELMKLVVVR